MDDLLKKALMTGRNKKTALEEYLVATGEKKPAVFMLSESEICLQDVFSDVRVKTEISLKEEGYVEVFISSADPFIRVETASAEPVRGGTDVYFTVRAEMLHSGKNYARILFKSAYQEFTLQITVDNRIALKVESYSARRLPADITADYLGFRMGRLSLSLWYERTFKKLSALNGNAPEDLFFMLYRVHVEVICKKKGEAADIMEYVSRQLEVRSDYSAELFAYYLYVRSLYEKDEAMTLAAVRNIRAFYEDSPSWQLLWMLFYTDEEFSENAPARLDAIRKLFLEGKCKSPVMYFEAWEILRDNPDLAAGDMNFLLQVMNFAVKYEISDPACVLRLADTIYASSKEELSGINMGLALKILKDAFDKYPVSSLGNTIAKLLVYSNSRSTADHIYFERAVFDFADIPLLYNYYMYTIPEDEMPILPERILKYFSGNPAYLFENRQNFFANVITNRYKNYAYKSAYEECAPQILSFACDKAVSGKNSSLLGVIYDHALKESGEDTDLKRALFRVAFIKQITCENKKMARVIVIHKELATYQEELLEDEKALVSIFSCDPLILFKDATGTIYKNIGYTVTEFEDEQSYIDKCIGMIPLMSIMLMGKSLEAAQQRYDPELVLSFLLSEFKKENFTPEYKRQLLIHFLEYYRAVPVSERAVGLLMEFLKEDVGVQARALLTELMIKDHDYARAKDEIAVSGCEYISDEALRELTHVLVQLDCPDDRPITQRLSCECLLRGAADDDILRYMCENCEGPFDILKLLYEECEKNGINGLKAAERMLVCAAAEDKENDIIPGVLVRSFNESENKETADHYIEYCAERYLYGDEKKVPEAFTLFERELIRGIRFSDAACAGYLLYLAGKKTEDELIKPVQSLLERLAEKGIMLEEFKQLDAAIKLPPVLSNTHIAEYMTAEEEAPEIKYTLSFPGGKLDKTAKMEMILPGVYVKYFSILFADTLRYSINENKSVCVAFSDMRTEDDRSRYVLAGEVSRLSFSGKEEELTKALKEYYIADEIIKRLF